VVHAPGAGYFRSPRRASASGAPTARAPGDLARPRPRGPHAALASAQPLAPDPTAAAASPSSAWPY